MARGSGDPPTRWRGYGVTMVKGNGWGEVGGAAAVAGSGWGEVDKIMDEK